MQAQNADEIFRRRLACRSWRSPSGPTMTVAGDAEDDAGLSTMTTAADDEAPASPNPTAPPPWRIIERDTTRGEGSPARTMLASTGWWWWWCSGATAAAHAAVADLGVDRVFRSRPPRSGSSQMRPDEPCRRNDTDDLCSLDIDRRRLLVTTNGRSMEDVRAQRRRADRGRRRSFARTLSASSSSLLYI
ncbi:hypothetical protein GQ55_2G062300 [Panicum hallii var. hallii]|uniref:Uncharacterized protein n=1 Tax=Panicum hallii var. hallii TaxID=1504633 RepID=A0A2T7EM05_9POAL|nr:hypothetical protein GQ55_2G062300 [Panicum hallii var. hallii]